LIMEITPFLKRDMDLFFALAEAEGWISEQWELEFLLSTFPSGCMVCRVGNETAGFVTAIRYGRGGWIGNLIVRPDQRGKGIGTVLLLSALSALEIAGVRTVWLTASAEGRAIYERMGFKAVDTIKRWRVKGHIRLESLPVDMETLLEIDGSGWDDRRETLMRVVAGRGTVMSQDNGFIVVQPMKYGIQLGPWGCCHAGKAEDVLDRIFTPAAEESNIFLDVPEGNGDAGELLRNAGFAVLSKTTLMFRGDPPDYDPRVIFALASMGSMG
jgi:ribosomal protein S18 acetylase RimI-like enzyme